MATRVAPIYKEKDTLVESGLLDQLQEAVCILGNKLVADKTIMRNGHTVGYGIDKTQKDIAADRVISIAKAIKSKKGW